MILFEYRKYYLFNDHHYRQTRKVDFTAKVRWKYRSRIESFKIAVRNRSGTREKRGSTDWWDWRKEKSKAYRPFAKRERYWRCLPMDIMHLRM